MFMHRIDLIGLEYAVMLGVWWGVAVVLTVLYMAIRRTVARWSRSRSADRATRAVTSGRLDG
jgi:hypothetical protein